MRDVVGQEGLDKVFQVLRAPHTEEPTNWSRRYKANLEKLALPPGSHATVQLLDTSRADAPAVVVAEQRIAITGQVPIPFSLDYDAAGLEPKNTYVVSARITHGDQLLFISDKATPVITRGNPLEADLVLKKVSAKQ